MKKAFSLLEIIFVIAVIALITSFAINNTHGFLEKAHITKIKAEVALIQNALNTVNNKRILKGLSGFPLVLDKAKNNQENEQLFKGVEDEKLLDYPLISTSGVKKEVGAFIKISSKKYQVFINKENFVEFIYNPNEGTFICNTENVGCKELN